MNTGGFAQMSHNGFAAPTGMGMPAGGLASRRGGGQNIKPLSFDVTKTIDPKDNGIPTPRTSRSHLLAGLRTAPKSATVATFGLASPTTSGPSQSQAFNRVNGMQSVQEHMNGPKTSLPRMATQNQPHHQQFLQQQQQQQQQRAVMMQQQQQRDSHQHFTTEQILAPPEIMLDEQEQMDPNLYNQLVATNMYLAQQQQRLQQQLLSVQAAAQQFQGMNLNSQASFQQQMALQNLYQQQQQQLSNLQQSMAQVMPAQQNVYSYYDPVTGQQGYYVDQGHAAQVQAAASYMDQTPATPHAFGQQTQRNGTPRVQVSPPMESQRGSFRTNSPPKKLELSGEHEPLPPPSANAFRRGHKKAPSLAKLTLNNTAVIEEAPASAGLKPAVLPTTSAAPSGYGPGQARAGEHPVRQPRGPPALEELKAKPTTYFEGSKNFSTRTRRSALKNLVKAGLERRKGGSSCGSMSPVSESAEELATPMTDDESDSGQSGSGSLSGDAEPSLASSRTSTSGSWGAIGSERPGSRQKTRKSHESLSSACESDGSFASVFKHGAQRGGKEELADGQRKTRLVLTSAEKRKSSNPVA